MNNKGFAISAMLYGTFLLFLILLLMMLGMLNNLKNNMDILIDGTNGARKIVEKKCSDIIIDPNNDGKYQLSDNPDFGTDAVAFQKFQKVVTLCGGIVG